MNCGSSSVIVDGVIVDGVYVPNFWVYTLTAMFVVQARPSTVLEQNVRDNTS